MKDQSSFYRLLRQVKRQLWFGKVAYFIQLLFLLTGALLFLFIFLSWFLVFPYWERYLFITCGIALIGLVVFFYKTKPTLHNASNVYDQFVSEQRVSTALSIGSQDSFVSQLVVQDAVKHMQKVHLQVINRKKKWFYPLFLVPAVCLLIGSGYLYLNPSDSMITSENIEKRDELMEKTVKQFQKLVKEEKDPMKKEELEKTLKEIVKEKKVEKQYEQLVKKERELNLKKREEMKLHDRLSQLQKQLTDSKLNKIANAISQKNHEELNKELSKLTDEQRRKLTEMLNQTRSQKISSNMSQEALENMIKQLEELQKLSEVQNVVQQEVQNLEQGMNSANIDLPSQLAMQSANQSSSQSQQGQNFKPSQQSPSNGAPQNASGNSQGQSPGQGQGSNGSGGGNGQTGSGSGNGTGQGANGGGSGQASGAGGNGAGVGTGSRELLTIPETISSSENIERDNGNLGEGSSGTQFPSNGPILRGTIRQYQEVYNQYYSSYRKSNERQTLPADLENIVESYFTEIDPAEE